MSAAKAKTRVHKTRSYTKQNGGGPLTVAQERQLRKTDMRFKKSERLRKRNSKRKEAA